MPKFFEEFLRGGGDWLGSARSWLQRKKHNGSRVTWGSADVLEPPMTVHDVEELAADSAWAAYKMGVADAKKESDPKIAEVRRLLKLYNEGSCSIATLTQGAGRALVEVVDNRTCACPTNAQGTTEHSLMCRTFTF